MAIIGFLCLSLGSNTVQLHDSLVSVVKMATVLEEYNTDDQRSVVRFLWAKGLDTKDIHKEMLTVESVCHFKQFTTESSNCYLGCKHFAGDEQVETVVVWKWLR
jgi:hypothetical protein